MVSKRWRAGCRGLYLAMMIALAATACGGSEPTIDLVLEDGLRASFWADGFSGPTQMTFTASGQLIIAELNGAENDATGRVLLVDIEDRSERTVLQTGLDKPTGVAVVDDTLWIMERDRLSFTSLTPGDERTVFADELPNNGRSEGTLTVLADGSLLYDTSGSKRGSERVAGSATIFRIAQAGSDPQPPEPVATGFKHAYAQVQDEQGQLWSVEMTDGRFDDQRASDELIAVSVGDDAGWPQCVDDNRPVIEFGGSAEVCANAPRSHALLGLGATPTSIVIVPWDQDQFLIALWLPGQVVSVPRSAPGEAPHEPSVVITGIESPQHLLVDGDQVLISDHETGIIYAVSAAD